MEPRRLRVMFPSPLSEIRYRSAGLSVDVVMGRSPRFARGASDEPVFRCSTPASPWTMRKGVMEYGSIGRYRLCDSPIGSDPQAVLRRFIRHVKTVCLRVAFSSIHQPNTSRLESKNQPCPGQSAPWVPNAGPAAPDLFRVRPSPRDFRIFPKELRRGQTRIDPSCRAVLWMNGFEGVKVLETRISSAPSHQCRIPA